MTEKGGQTEKPYMEQPQFLLDQVKAVISDCRSFSNAPVVQGGAGYRERMDGYATPLGDVACIQRVTDSLR